MVRFAVLGLLVACSSPSPGAGGDDVPTDGTLTGNGDVFTPDVTDVVVEIDYESGQEPFTGQTIGMGDTFDLSQANLERLFANKKAITLPRTTAEMEDIGTVGNEELAIPEILQLAQQHRDRHDDATTKTYYVVFVSGHFKDEAGTVQTGVLGVSIGTTGVIAMFKDTIRSTDVIGFPNVVRFVEQSTLIHELSHGFGLVDNGVPMVTAHRDPDASHGRHCDNDKCVMYYLNEGASDATAFVMQQVLTGSTILFDDHCLADADAQTGGL